MSWWEVNLLTVTAIAKHPREQARRGGACVRPAGEAPAQARPPACLAQASRHSSRSSLCCLFYTVCGLEMNVKTYRGHLPFCASSAFIAWTWCWPGEGRGQCCGGATQTPSAETRSVQMWRPGSGKRLGTAPSRRNHVKGGRWTRSCRWIEDDPARKMGLRKLHYQEYLDERISVNPNRYKTLVCCFVRFIERCVLLLLPFLAFSFWFSFFEVFAF